MMTLYFSPGACSLASHIGLEETGAPYELKPVLLAKGQQRTEEYLKINPRGKVPAFSVDGKILVENTAILTYLARRFPEKRLMPADPAEEARCIGTMCWFSSIVHPSYQRFHRPERFAESEAAQTAVKQNGRKTFWANLQNRLDDQRKRLDHGPRLHGGRRLRSGFLRLGDAQRISGERAERLYRLAGAHDATPDG
jgi:glutathione S-transferase